MKKVIKYIDCDGVILDTEFGLFDEYNRLKDMGADIKRLTYLQQLDWREWIRQAKIINNAIAIIKEHNPDDTEILTKVHSLSEGLAKIEYFRELGIKNNIVLVEAKNSNIKNVIIRQLYYPLRQWSIHTQKDVTTLFFEKRKNEFLIWEFEFLDINKYNSIRLKRSAKYRIVSETQ